jgi:hypothetical protein
VDFRTEMYREPEEKSSAAKRSGVGGSVPPSARAARDIASTVTAGKKHSDEDAVPFDADESLAELRELTLSA